MKTMKKIYALLIAVVMVFGMSTSVFAQTVGTAADGKGSITISNASKGETYAVYKLFDATNSVAQTEGESNSIAYTGTIPDSLATYFVADDAGNITATDAAKNGDSLSDDAIAALTAWAKTQTATASVVSDGSELTFTGLDYGYYVVTTTQGETAISVDSTKPNATIIDKNTTPPVGNPTKKADDTDVYIGQTVTYTVSFGTANYDENAKQIIQYEIADTLPTYLTDVTVTSIKVIESAAKEDDPATEEDETAAEVSTDLTSLGADFATAKKITIPWVSEGTNLYKNGSTIEITYTAKVGDQAVIDGAGNKNKVTITYTTSDGTPHEDTTVVEETIYTYAAALQKIDENKKPLAGAKFKANGLTVTGSAGDYTVTAYDKDSTTPGTEMECDAEGQLVIKGLPSDVTLTLTETEAPKGYNKLTETASLTPVKIDEEVISSEKTIYYDANGKVTAEETETSYTKTTYNVNLLKAATQVINNKGTELPSTGGIGTTLFYVIGTALVLGSGVLLVSKKRMSAN